MRPMYYIGLDVHKKKISYCVKDGGGKVHAEGWIPATRFDLNHGRKSNTRGEGSEELHPRSSEARQENLCPLGKDLSWKSDNR